MPESTSPTQTKYMVCIGEREAQGKTVIAWLESDKDGVPTVEDGRFVYWTKMRRWSGMVIGGVYQFTGDDKGWFVKGEQAPKYIKRCVDTARVRVWEAADRVTQDRVRRERQEKKHAASPMISQPISTLRDVYRSLPAADRRAFLLYVMTEIEKTTR